MWITLLSFRYKTHPLNALFCQCLVIGLLHRKKGVQMNLLNCLVCGDEYGYQELQSSIDWYSIFPQDKQEGICVDCKMTE
jgi:transcription elongation factor Elf1